MTDKVYAVTIEQRERGEPWPPRRWPIEEQTFHIRAANARRAIDRALSFARKEFLYRSKPLHVTRVEETVEYLRD